MLNQALYENKQISKIYDLATKKIIPHALLFESDNKDLCINLAINVAQILMCQSKKNTACGICDNCKKIISSIHPDIEFINSQNNQKTIGIDIIRTLRQNAYITPNESYYKIYIFPDSSIITPQAQNALLKILEEPPKSVIFIMICQNKLKLLSTILSRLTCFKIYSNKIEVNDDIFSEVKNFFQSLLDKNELEILKIFSKFSKSRIDFIEFLNHSQHLIIENYILSISSGKIIKILDVISECKRLIEKNINMSLIQCYLCSNLVSIIK